MIAAVLVAAAAAAGIVGLLAVMLGWPGLAIAAAGAAAVLIGYRVLVQPWQHRWGATDEEVRRAMPSADRIIPELQALEVGDQIPMLPGAGPRVRELRSNRYLVAGDDQGGTWCLALYPTAGGCRLVSRWRANWPLTPATAFWILLSDPGTFVMERRMLKGIKARVERAGSAGPASLVG